ncbi:hypothetical protein B9N43_01740 [Denitratisoma sp. DHT3]|nr:hypothetical protein B9N43_01740 [Denitratisoma sp. DHT3]
MDAMDAMEDKDVLHQADALMKRWRTTHAPVAEESAAIPQAPPPESPAAEEEDFPLLTEAVGKELPAVAQPPTPLDPVPDPRQILRDELDHWLDHALPDAVLKVLDGLADQLIGQLGQQARQELLPRLEAALEARRNAGHRAPEEPGDAQAGGAATITMPSSSA